MKTIHPIGFPLLGCWVPSSSETGIYRLCSLGAFAIVFGRADSKNRQDFEETAFAEPKLSNNRTPSVRPRFSFQDFGVKVPCGRWKRRFTAGLSTGWDGLTARLDSARSMPFRSCPGARGLGAVSTADERTLISCGAGRTGSPFSLRRTSGSRDSVRRLPATDGVLALARERPPIHWVSVCIRSGQQKTPIPCDCTLEKCRNRGFIREFQNFLNASPGAIATPIKDGNGFDFNSERNYPRPQHSGAPRVPAGSEAAGIEKDPAKPSG